MASTASPGWIMILYLSRPAWAMNSYNATTDQNQIVCIYPISGQYSLLARILYYGLLIFSVLNTRRVWLVAGALASALIYSATAAVRAFLLAIISNNSLLDTDAFGIWAVVSVGCLAVYPVRELSSTLQKSPARPVFGFWGTLVTIGSICSATTILRDYPSENKCLSSSGKLLDSPWLLLDHSFNCTYSCFSTHQILRGQSEITVISMKRLFGFQIKYFIVTCAINMIAGAAFGIFACCLTRNRRTEAELKEDIKNNRLSDYPAGTKYRRNAAKQKKRDRAELKALQDGEEDPRPYHLYRCVGGLNPLFFIIVMVLNEVYLLGRGALPVGENSYAIGQWGPWVGTALALVSSWIVKIEEPATEQRLEQIKKEKEERDKRLAEKKKAEELRLASTERANKLIELAKQRKDATADAMIALANEMGESVETEQVIPTSKESLELSSSSASGRREENEIELEDNPRSYARSMIMRDLEAGLGTENERLRSRSRGTW